MPLMPHMTEDVIQGPIRHKGAVVFRQLFEVFLERGLFIVNSYRTPGDLLPGLTFRQASFASSTVPKASATFKKPVLFFASRPVAGNFSVPLAHHVAMERGWSSTTS
jgi:hypothetical protein